ncbi:hypothetical protein HS088_TW04G01534 [Tripterygium wilfordii]|uniref:Stress induced protein n=1 Tax=Tripterygium wilfordii TaxID=458696 RepID=A0A7J7DTT6_TRIWF|nr:uncharacterized protein LOC119997392 [Tripterygium wilfordii]KAF5749564.1 hypothetical protein HS088_TW04G01534 [Tripterygium wilfordii]
MEEISPLKEHSQGSDDIDDYVVEDESPSGCACFKFFSFKNHRRSNDNNEYNHLLNQREENREGWWAEKLRKVKETTELVAGPKWKNFIRKIGGYFNKKRLQRNNKFQYDPQSYALNFDGGIDEEEDDDLIRGFSARFAPPFSAEKQRGSSGL